MPDLDRIAAIPDPAERAGAATFHIAEALTLIEQLSALRDDAVREALRAGTTIRALREATGLSVARLSQIRHRKTTPRARTAPETPERIPD